MLPIVEARPEAQPKDSLAECQIQQPTRICRFWAFVAGCLELLGFQAIFPVLGPWGMTSTRFTVMLWYVFFDFGDLGRPFGLPVSM